MVRAAAVATTMAAAALVLTIALSTAPAASAIDYTEQDLASEASLWALYERWCAHYDMARDAGEKARRFDLFKENARRIHEHNTRGNATYTLGLNRFSDMTDEEFSSSPYGHCLTLPPVQRMSDDGGEEEEEDGSSLSSSSFNLTGGALGVPAAVDWRGKAVARVKNQGNFCGSCWAFSAISAVEGINAIRTGRLVPLSEQQLVDCDKVDHGCRGGLMTTAFNYIMSTRGVVPESAYPYRGRQGRCRHVITATAVAIDGYQRVPPYNADALMSAVAAQPVTVGIEASAFEFVHYRSGVFNGNCGGKVGHAATVVGYSDGGAGGPYWVVKNSWGPTWGEGGYVRISRSTTRRQGVCSILTIPSYPIKR